MAQNKPTQPLAFKALKTTNQQIVYQKSTAESLLQYVLWHCFSAFSSFKGLPLVCSVSYVHPVTGS